MKKPSVEINPDKPEPKGRSRKKGGAESTPEAREVLILARVNAEIKRLEAEAEARFEGELKKIRARAKRLMEQERANVAAILSERPLRKKRAGGVVSAGAPAAVGARFDDDATRVASKLLADYAKMGGGPGGAGRADGLLVTQLVTHMVRLPESMGGIICDQVLMAKRSGREMSFQSIAEEAVLEHLAGGGGVDYEGVVAGVGGEKRTTHTLRLNPDLSDALLVRVHTAKKMGARRVSLQSMVISAIHHYMVKNRWL
jgi:hypothetical protein